MSGRRWVLAGLVLLCGAVLSGCGGKKVKDFYTMPPMQAYERGRQLLEQGKNIEAMEVFQSIDLRFADDRSELEPLVRLAIADATFYRGSILDLIDARSLYLDFVTLFGDHERAAYAQFQAGVCSLAQANHPAKDQSQTRAAFTDLREVEVRYPSSRYAIAAGDMIQQAEDNLAEHEFIVGRFYLKRKKYLAASDRFRTVLQKYPQYEDPEKIYFHLARALIGSDNDAEARIYLDKVVEDYPDGKYAEQARESLKELGAPQQVNLAGAPR